MLRAEGPRLGHKQRPRGGLRSRCAVVRMAGNAVINDTGIYALRPAWVTGSGAVLQSERSPVQLPRRALAWDAGSVPVRARVSGNHLCFSLPPVSPSLSHSLLPSAPAKVRTFLFTRNQPWVQPSSGSRKGWGRTRGLGDGSKDEITVVPKRHVTSHFHSCSSGQNQSRGDAYFQGAAGWDFPDPRQHPGSF